MRKIVVFAVLSSFSMCGCRIMSAEELGLTPIKDSITIKKNLFGASMEVYTGKDSKHHLIVPVAEWSRTKDGSTFKLTGLDSDYSGNASAVVTAEVDRMKAAVAIADAQARFAEAQGRAAALAIQAGGDAVGKVGSILTAPFIGASFQTSGPGGISGTVKTGTGVTPSPPTNTTEPAVH